MTKKRICRVILCLMIFALMPVQVNAIDRIDLEKPVTLTIHFAHQGQPLPGAEFDIYKVADFDEQGNYTFLEGFDTYPVQYDDIKGIEGSSWAALASSLSSYVQADSIPPTDVAITDETGTAHFPRVKMPMEPGIYLVTGKTLTYNDMCFTPAPTLIALPNREGDSHHWDYDVEVTMKYSVNTAPIDLTVVKKWSDEGHEKERPASVKVELRKDGKVYDTVTLSKSNGWTHSWSGLDRAGNWTVTEQVSGDYKVSITQGSTTFTVTNTYDKPGGKLPQTGSLWWPVPAMMIAGLGCLIAGLMRKRKIEDEA